MGWNFLVGMGRKHLGLTIYFPSHFLSKVFHLPYFTSKQTQPYVWKRVSFLQTLREMSIITPYYYYNRYDIISTYNVFSIINILHYQIKTLISFWCRHEFHFQIFYLTTENFTSLINYNLPKSLFFKTKLTMSTEKF